MWGGPPSDLHSPDAQHLVHEPAIGTAPTRGAVAWRHLASLIMLTMYIEAEQEAVLGSCCMADIRGLLQICGDVDAGVDEEVTSPAQLPQV